MSYMITRGRTTAFILSLALMCVIALMAASRAVAAPASGGKEPIDELRTLAPGLDYHLGTKIDPFTAETLDGKKIDFKNYLGKKVIVLGFWLSQCDLCISELKELQDVLLKNKIKDKVAVFTVVRVLDKYELRNTRLSVKESGIKFPVLKDPVLKISRSFSIMQVPSFVIIGLDSKMLTPPVHHLRTAIRDLTFEDFLLMTLKGSQIPPLQLKKPDASYQTRKMVGQTPPDFTLKSINGEQFSLADVLGKKTIILAFWHPDNPSSEKPMKDLQEFINNARNFDDVVTVSLTSLFGQKQLLSARAFADTNNITYPILVDHGSTVGRKYDITAVPSIFIVCPDSTIAEVLTDFTGVFADNLRAALGNCR